jgi:hypothetical protein
MRMSKDKEFKIKISNDAVIICNVLKNRTSYSSTDGNLDAAITVFQHLLTELVPYFKDQDFSPKSELVLNLKIDAVSVSTDDSYCAQYTKNEALSIAIKHIIKKMINTN